MKRMGGLKSIKKLAPLLMASLALVLSSLVMAKLVVATSPATKNQSRNDRTAQYLAEIGLEYVSAVIPVAASTLAAAIALHAVASAGFAAATERPELRGLVMIMAGLAEGIAIYGLLISILILSKI
ncbi:MAG: ATPase [Thermoprotei archaeon]|nr:MAG: ATPase [Thermoprotei archaeon]